VKPSAKPASQVASFANLLVSEENCQMGLEETKVEVEVGRTTRSALLSLPSAVFAGKLPLWLVFHGTDGQAADFLRYSGLDDFSRANHIALVVPQALPNSDFYGQSQFNVGLHSQREDREGVHDVELTRAVLEQVMRLPCIDVQRIHCTGYSNGARFCIRLASELPGLIASVAPISGLRYPSPNNASRAIPILAFHGDADPVNPWGGHGLGYWHSSVPASLQRWAKFNRCSLADWPPSFREHQGFAVASYEGCQDDATVKLVRLHGAGHQWPSAAFEIPNLGKVARIDANSLIYEFFDKHRLPDEWSILQLKMQAAGAMSVEQSSPRFGALLWVGIAALGPLLFWTLMARRRSECCRDTPRSELGPLLLADVGSPSHASLLP